MNSTTLTIAGNLTKAPELKFSRKDGQPFAVLSVAVNDSHYDRESEQWLTTDTTYYDLVCFGQIGANALASFKVGDPVLAVGRFRVRDWETDTGRGKSATITVDDLGPNVRFGTASLAKGRAHYAADPLEAQVGTGPELGYSPEEMSARSEEARVHALADHNGEVSEEDAEELLQRSA